MTRQARVGGSSHSGAPDARWVRLVGRSTDVDTHNSAAPTPTEASAET
jgi:hypothetical protein